MSAGRGPGLPTPSHSVPAGDADVVAELLDENRVLEKELAELKTEAAEKASQLEKVVERSLRKEKVVFDCLEALVGYCSMLEQNVVQPAVGRLLECLKSHHPETAASRDDLVARISGVPISAGRQPELVKLFGHFQNPGTPGAIAASEERRRQIWEAVTGGQAYYEPEDAYTAAAALIQEKEQLNMILCYCARELQNGRQEGGGQEVGPRDSVHLRKQTEVLQQQNNSLKKEIQRLEQVASSASTHVQEVQVERERNARDVQSLVHDLQQLKAQNQALQGDFQLVLQEKNIMSQQGRSLESTVREERAILNQKIESMQNSITQLQAQRTSLKDRAEGAERELKQAQDRLHATEAALQAAQRSTEDAERKSIQLQQERAIVRQRFETVEKALHQGASEKQMLHEEVEELRLRLSAAHPGQINNAAVETGLRERLQQERAEVNLLRDELQRARSAGASGELGSMRQEVRRLRDEQQHQASAYARLQEQAHESETGLQERVVQLESLAQRLKAELEQQLGANSRSLDPAATPGRGGGTGSSAAPLPSGVSPQEDMRGRITSFEMCINQLSSEMGNVEGKINSLDRAAGDQSSAHLAARLERERQQFEQERSECDQIVQRMADELELLIRENQQLKARQKGDASGTWSAGSPARPGITDSVRSPSQGVQPGTHTWPMWPRG